MKANLVRDKKYQSVDLYGTALESGYCQSSVHHHQALGRKQRALMTLPTLLPCNSSVSIIYSKHIQNLYFIAFSLKYFPFNMIFSNSETSVQPQTLQTVYKYQEHQQFSLYLRVHEYLSRKHQYVAFASHRRRFKIILLFLRFIHA